MNHIEIQKAIQLVKPHYKYSEVIRHMPNRGKVFLHCFTPTLDNWPIVSSDDFQVAFNMARFQFNQLAKKELNI